MTVDIDKSAMCMSPLRILEGSSLSSVQFSSSVVSNSLRLHESQHTRPPCPSQTPGVYSNSCPSSWWCHPAISSSVVPFSSCPQSFPASGSFPTSQLFAWGGQSIGVSASASVLPMNIQDWSPLGWTGWISLQSKGLSRVFSNTTVQKHQFFGAQLSSQPFSLEDIKKKKKKKGGDLASVLEMHKTFTTKWIKAGIGVWILSCLGAPMHSMLCISHYTSLGWEL